MAKSKKSKASSSSKLTLDPVVAPMVVVRPVEPAAPPAAPVRAEVALDRAEVARLAFAKFAARGYTHGRHVTDWLEAEAELRARN